MVDGKLDKPIATKKIGQQKTMEVFVHGNKEIAEGK
jgi:hypothetical protein